MAVVKQAYANAVAPWDIATLCNDVRDAFIGAGLMTAWFDSFTSGGYEHRILQITYDAAKTYGKTYYWFTFNGAGIWVRTNPGWNATTHLPAGAGGTAGVNHLDWYSSGTVPVTTDISYSVALIALSTSISFSVTRYTSAGRSFFTLRTGTSFLTFTIDPSSTTFRPFYDLNLGYHSGFYTVSCNGNRQFDIQSIHRHRRELFLGSAVGASSAQASATLAVNRYCLPFVNTYTAGNGSTFPSDGFVLPCWTTQNPSITSTFNPIFNNLRISSIHLSDLPSDFGITTCRVSNTMAIQDNATVTAGVEEYEILQFLNVGVFNSGGFYANPIFIARTV
jgi:hypothetical protein